MCPFSKLKKDNPSNDFDSFLSGKLKKIFYSNISSFDFTVPSILPSWWEKENEKIYLCQRITADEYADYAKILKKITEKCIPEQKTEIKNGLIKTDYSSHAGMDCIWLSDLQNKTGKAEKEHEETFETIKKIIKEAEKENISLSANQIGIGYEKDASFPVLIF